MAKYECKHIRIKTGQVCGYIWDSNLPDGELPKACPECKSRNWNVEKKVKSGKGE